MSTTATTPARPLRQLVPFFVPGSLVPNDAHVVDPASALVEEPPTTVAVRKWDRATGVFVDPQLVKVRQASSEATAQQPVTNNSSVSLLTPAAIVARRRSQVIKSDTTTNALCGRTPPAKRDIDLPRRREQPANPHVKTNNDFGGAVARCEIRPKPNTRRHRSQPPRSDMLNSSTHTRTRSEAKNLAKPSNTQLSSTKTNLVVRHTAQQVSKTDAPDFTTRKTRPKDTSPLSGVSPEDYLSSIPVDKNHAQPITPRSRDLSPLPTSYASSECATPDAKKERRANSLSPVGNVRTIAVPQRSPGIKYAGMSFEAASPSPISIPIPRLAGRRHSIVFPTDNMKVRAVQSDGGIRILSRCGSDEKKVVDTRSGHQQTV